MDVSSNFQFREIHIDTEEYRKTLTLRDAILRVPIGLRLNAEDTAGENQQLHFGMFAEAELVASVVAKPLAEPTGVKLRQMAVEVAFQGQGIGQKLLAEVENSLSARGYSNLELSARWTAVGFYQKLGYHKIGQPFIEKGIDHITMQKGI